MVEVLVVIFALAILVAMLLPAFAAAKRGGGPNCQNKLKQIGLGFQIWAGDNGGKYPMEVSITNGGAMEPSASGNAVAVFQVMSNELSTPKLLVCRQDKDKTYATNFAYSFTAKNISYFAAVDAKMNSPQSFLAGDDNFQIRGTPVKSGLITLSSSSPVAWTSARHVFAGYLVFADGSVQAFNNGALRELLQHTAVTNHLAIP